jgi:Flp pilus assembly protein TadG
LVRLLTSMTASLQRTGHPRQPVSTGLTLARQERGAAIVEMALVLPLLVALLMGMLV